MASASVSGFIPETLQRPAPNDNDYLAKPPSTCCLSGTLHTGTPRGAHETIASLDTYIVKPPSSSENGHVLLYFPDVWGFFANGFLVMDAFADAGYLVLGPDYFRGDPVWKHRTDGVSEPGFDYEEWKRVNMEFAEGAVPKWVDEVRERFGKGKKFACVGYCFGAPFVCNELSDAGICDAGAFAHPAFLKESHFRCLRKPLFLSCSQIDHTFGTEDRNRAVGMLTEDGREFQVQLFAKVKHGFALRANLENPYERYVKEQSLKAIVEYLDFWLTQKL
ncbi:alpha/beta-hydrolase [Pseudovirgaria hyperparasitica]|uniref:Alpha/beta-hydrolase n=1 Tax=Pseudovirgaria hyperparasitica TaxID=470096 RepID=A0A6A6VYM1_9PEZI|nr:alpha/beta-hydrolase [Pseudovirgaria hyperparasitica]KAF2754407.1 alpha/beta-hydrolase [Pseudovirgaria hyperparasitica]